MHLHFKIDSALTKYWLRILNRTRKSKDGQRSFENEEEMFQLNSTPTRHKSLQ